MTRAKSKRNSQKRGRKVVVRRTITVKSPRRRMGRRMGMTMTRAYADSLVDPFQYSACLPDGTRGAGCFTLKEAFSFTTGAATGTCNALFWNPGNDPTTALWKQDTGSVVAVPTVTGNWSQCTAHTTVNAQYAKVRCVSSGLRVSYIGPTVTDNGVIVIGTLSPAQTINNFDSVAIGTAINALEEYKMVPLRDGGQVTWRPSDVDDTCQFNTVANTTAAVSTSFVNGPSLVIFVYGAAPGQATIFVEAVANYQGQYRLQNLLPGGSTSAESMTAEPGWYENAKNLTSSIPSIITNIGNVMQQMAPVLGAIRPLANGISYARGLGGNSLNPKLLKGRGPLIEEVF